LTSQEKLEMGKQKAGSIENMAKKKEELVRATVGKSGHGINKETMKKTFEVNDLYVDAAIAKLKILKN